MARKPATPNGLNLSDLRKSHWTLDEIIRSAFGISLHEPLLSHDECVQWREHLSLLTREDTLKILPSVLIDLLETHTGDSIHDGEVHSVAIYLNLEHRRVVREEFGAVVDDERSESPVTELRGEMSPYTPREDEMGWFTPDQARAVCLWIEEALGWPEFEDDIYRDELYGALATWKRIAAERSLIPRRERFARDCSV